MYMTVVPLAEVRADLSKYVSSAHDTHERIEITRNGTRAAVLLGVDDYDALIETIEILSNSAVMADLAEADADIAAGNLSSHEDVLDAMRANGRR
jgi:prevent-host-death family protein